MRTRSRHLDASLAIAITLLCGGFAAANTPRLEDTGHFRVGSQLGEERAGFSGRPQVLVFTHAGADDWPGIRECLGDPLLDPDMEYFTGVLIDDIDEPDLESGFREQGIQVVIRSLSGAVLGLLKSGFSCLDLVRLLENARRIEPREPEKSPIYAVLFDDPSAIERVAVDFGCANASKFVNLFEEFEGSDSPKVAVARSSLASRCVTFVRGDVNEDGTVDISDAIFGLGFLFLGDPLSLCEDAADANDDGALDISDALYLLSYLFICASVPPSQPFPMPGTDPSDDPLACR